MITLKTLESATDQEVFNQIANHLISQNTKSSKDGGSFCHYRGSNNTKCAAGCIIADDEYKDCFEGKDWSQMVRRGYATPRHEKLIIRLQLIHDGSLPTYWKRDLISLAESLNLDHSFIK